MTMFTANLSIFNHSVKIVFTVFEPCGECFRVTIVSVLKGVLTEADHIEVALDEVDDHLLVGELLVLRSHVIFPLNQD